MLAVNLVVLTAGYSDEQISCKMYATDTIHLSEIVIQSKPLKYIALGPDYKYLLRQSINLSTFYILHCV